MLNSPQKLLQYILVLVLCSNYSTFAVCESTVPMIVPNNGIAIVDVSDLATNPSPEPTTVQLNSSNNSQSPSLKPTARRCFDPDQVDLGRVCTLVYKPVCGCNNITYSNECEAGREG